MDEQNHVSDIERVYVDAVRANHGVSTVVVFNDALQAVEAHVLGKQAKFVANVTRDLLTEQGEELERLRNKLAAYDHPSRESLALSFIHEYDGGTVDLGKCGDQQYGERWTVDFYAGYTRKNYHGEGSTLYEAMVDAVQKWPSAKEAWNKALSVFEAKDVL